MRVLNSMSTQAAFRAKGLRSSEDTGERKPKPKPTPASKSSSSNPGSSSKGSTSTSTSSDKTAKLKPKAKDMQNPSTVPNPPSAKGSGGGGNKSSIPSIMPHESLGEYNRRVESVMRSGVSQAIKSANKTKAEQEKAARLAKEERRKASMAGKPDPLLASSKSEGDNEKGSAAKSSGTKRKHDVTDAPLEFAEKSGPRRLNDIAQAPPSLPKLRVARDDDKGSMWTAKGKGRLGLSAGQERIMEEERERVIKQYREIKARKEAGREAERAKEEAARGKGKGKGQAGKKRKVEDDEEGAVRAVAGAAYDSD